MKNDASRGTEPGARSKSSTPIEPIHLFVPTYRVEECLTEIRECLEKGWTGLGFKTIAFEEAWKKYTGLPNAHFLASATAGLHLSVRLLKKNHGWKEGDEIITTPLTFVSTNHAILYERMRPVFADVDESLCLDPRSVEERITPRTRAVMFVGLGGNSGRLDEVAEICRSRDLRLIIDAAHMAGTRIRGNHVGFEGDAVVFSFHAVKNLPTADGGMVSFRDPDLDREARKWSWLGINKDTYSRTVSPGAYKWRYEVEEVGFKYHGNSVMAALGLVGLKYLDEDNGVRRRLSALYDQLLDGCPEVGSVPIAAGCEPSRHLYPILAVRRDGLMKYLNECGIYPGVHYRDNTTYPMYASGMGTCHRAAAATDRLVSLPLHVRMTPQDVERVARAVRRFYGRGAKAKSGIRAIETPRLRLRLVTEADLPQTLAWRNQDRVRKCFFTSEVLTESMHQSWFESYLQKEDDLVFIIELRGDERPVGQAAIYRIAGNSCEFGRLMIGEETDLGQGFATEATAALLRFAQEELKMRTVRLEVRKENRGALSLYKKLGFIETGGDERAIRMELVGMEARL